MIEHCPVETVLAHFAIAADIVDITPFGQGHINTSYHVINRSGPDYLLQKINRHVFKDIPGLMHNIHVVTQHIQQRLTQAGHPTPERAGLTLVTTHDDQNYCVDTNNESWRVFHFIDNSCTHELVTDPNLAENGAFAFGEFQRHVANINPNELSITISKFHHLPTRLTALEAAIQTDKMNRAQEVEAEINYVHLTQDHMHLTQRLIDSGKIPLRITHNDTKINNVLFNQTGEALCVIDLDTVMPGVFQFDFSDAVRAMANTAAEDEKDLSLVELNPELFAAIASGYLRATRDILMPTEIDLLATAASLMPFMLGLRFLTDYLQGDTYFKIHYPQHNLDRARCQFKLAQDIDSRVPELQQIIHALTR
jgi:hypothetical protein